MKSALLVLVAALAGCAAVPTKPVQRVPFSQDEYADVPHASDIGKAEVRGQAFLKTRGGDVKKGAGERVTLNPVTSYSEQWYAVSYVGGQPLEPPDNRVWNYVRETQADGDGRFTFTNVPAGDYFIVSQVFWEVPSGDGMRRTGSFIAKRISVPDNGQLDVVLTR